MRIDCVESYSRGLILAGEEGTIWTFEGIDDEDLVYQLKEIVESKDRETPREIQIDPANITQMVLSPEEDILFYTDRNNQLLKVDLSLFSKEDPGRSEYVLGPNHHEPITGMDICLRKQLIVTCS